MHSGIVSSFSTSSFDKTKVMCIAISSRKPQIKAEAADGWLRPSKLCEHWQTGWEDASGDERTTDDDAPKDTARGAGRLSAHLAAEKEGDHLALHHLRAQRGQAGLQGVRRHGARARF